MSAAAVNPALLPFSKPYEMTPWNCQDPFFIISNIAKQYLYANTSHNWKDSQIYCIYVPLSNIGWWTIYLSDNIKGLDVDQISTHPLFVSHWLIVELVFVQLFTQWFLAILNILTTSWVYLESSQECEVQSPIKKMVSVILKINVSNSWRDIWRANRFQLIWVLEWPVCCAVCTDDWRNN